MGRKKGARAMGGIKGGLLCLLLFICYPAPEPQRTWREYVAEHFPKHERKACEWIIIKESNGREKARNGSHYGLAQGKSEYLRTASVEEQVLWFKKYIRKRYKTCMMAKEHHIRMNWY